MFTAPVSRYMRNKKSNVKWSLPFGWIFNAVHQKEKLKHSTFPMLVFQALFYYSLGRGEFQSWSEQVPIYFKIFTFLSQLPSCLPKWNLFYFSHLWADLCVYIFIEIGLSIWIFKSAFRSSSEICKLLCCWTRQ